MTCSGLNVFTGLPVEVDFNGSIQAVRDSAGSGDRWIAPGWIDIQVNGFAGIDYNTPHITPEQIALSLDTMFSAGVTRCFPTVITGAPDDIVNSLRNLNK